MATRKAAASDETAAAPSRKRMIEDEIPLAEVNYHSSKEKKHPRRFVELIHQWPARRPRSACRVAIAAALLSAPATDAEKQTRLDLLKRLSPYECEKSALDEARALIRAEHGGHAPKVLDIFAGGGAIPLEAANLGCEAHAVELNPVAHIIELATCVYPQKYGTRLADLVEEWGQKLLKEVKARIGDLYPPIRIKTEVKDAPASSQLTFAHGKSSGGEKIVEPIAYLWTRTVPCSDKKCGATVPLVRQTWLCRKAERSIALRMVPDRAARRVRFEVVSAESPDALGFDPADHSERGDAECPLCGATIDADKVKEYGKAGLIGQQLMAVVGIIANERGRVYLPAEMVPFPSSAELECRQEATGELWPGTAAIKLPEDARSFWPYLYGLDSFDKFFFARQRVALLSIVDSIKRLAGTLELVIQDKELIRAIQTYLALALDKLAENCNNVCRWESSDQIIKSGVSKEGIKLTWDFAELNPIARISGSFPLQLEAQVEAIRGLAMVETSVSCVRGTATDLGFADDTFDAIITDPPYYDNVSYSDLSDFFYVWIRRCLENVYPEHLSMEQTPKRQEIIVVPYRHGNDDGKARTHFESLLTRAFHEAGRVVKPGCPVIVVYAHKTVAGWSTAVEALKKADCMVTEAWPLRTESDVRLNARNTAALATSIFLVARKRTQEKTCNDYDEEVLPPAHKVVDERVTTLWAHGITGADLVIAVIGAALGPFTEFSVVRRANGAEVKTAEFLEEAQRMALDAILRKLIRAADEQTDAAAAVNAIDPISRLYVVARLQFGEAPADYDVFKNLAIGALPPGMELDGMKGALMQGKSALLAKKGSKVSIHSFAERGSHSELGLYSDGKPASLIDVLHRLLWLQKNRSSEVASFVKECKADLEAVRLLAQALGGRPLRAEPTPGAQKDTRTEEQRAIDTLLATMQDLGRAAKTQEPLMEHSLRKTL
jgi:putative DNA methylase